jgi:hypothetical protein
MRALSLILLVSCTVPAETKDPVEVGDEVTPDTDVVVPPETADSAVPDVVTETADTATGGEIACDGFDDDGDGLIDEDFDRDGDGEARCCRETEYVLWYPDNGRPHTEVQGRPFNAQTGVFGPTSQFTPIQGTDVTVLAYGHFNEQIGSADHLRDLLWIDTAAPDVTYLTQCQYGEWTRTTVDVPWEGSPRSWGDFNGDGCMDFVEYDYPCCTFGNNGGTGLGTTRLGQCDGTFIVTPTTWDVLWLQGQWVGGMAYNSSDWNGDGKQDILMWSISNGGNSRTRVAYLPGDGRGDFGDPILVGENEVAANSPAMGDIDGDGHVDVVLGPNDDGGPSNPDAGQVWTLLGNGSAGTLGNRLLINPAWTTFPNDDGNGSARLWDYDKDGDLDLIVNHEVGDAHGIGFFPNDGAGNYPNTPTVELLPYFTWRSGAIVSIHQE